MMGSDRVNDRVHNMVNNMGLLKSNEMMLEKERQLKMKQNERDTYYTKKEGIVQKVKKTLFGLFGKK